MQIQVFLFVILVSVLSILAQVIEEGVLVGTDANFDKILADNEFVLAEFYAPWCGHCKTLAPEYAKAATALEAEGSSVKLVKIDATEQKDIGAKFDVKGFPTLKFFRGGAASDYGGGRTSDEIISWLKKKSGPVASTIATVEDLENMKEANDAFALGVFASEDSAAAKAFLAAAAATDAVAFGITTDAAVKSSLGLSGDSVVVLKSFDDLRNEMAVESHSTDKSISSFVAAHSVPLVQTFSDETSGKIFKSPINKHTLFFTDIAADHHAGAIAAFTEAGKAFRGKTMMINVPSTEARVLEFFGIKAEDLPVAVYADMSPEAGGMKKYPFTGTMDAASITSFLDDALAGNLAPTLKSEEPEAGDIGPVTVLKGKSFNELVIDNDNDVLVEFYAPWCGHCKSLAPIYDELGEALAGNDKITIAKMDATANEIDVEGVNVKGFPTIIFFKGNDKKNPVKYEEGRTKDDFLAYLKKNAHNSVPEIAASEEEEEEGSDEL